MKGSGLDIYTWTNDQVLEVLDFFPFKKDYFYDYFYDDSNIVYDTDQQRDIAVAERCGLRYVANGPAMTTSTIK